MYTGATRCRGCGAERDLTKPFCSACGTPATSAASGAPDSTSSAFDGLAIARPGPPCTVCAATSSIPSFDGWHYLVAVLGFPAGMLIFLAPKRVCTAGHAFGSGGLARAIGIALIALYVIFALGAVLWIVVIVLGVFRVPSAGLLHA